jgi:nicotinamide-nucleotide amidase
MTTPGRREVAWVLTIGDELLRGEVVDSNKSYLCERLLRLDLETARQVTVGDDAVEIETQLRMGASAARVILVSGGLGPTRDDITTEVVARTFGRRMIRDPEALEGIRKFFQSLGREMAENNAKQADFPEGAKVLPNPLGTAPGFMLDAEGCLIFCMPGVPRELYRMMDREVLPRLEARLASGQVLRTSLLRTFGLGESSLDRDLSDLARDDPGVSLGFRTQFPDNLVRVVARGADAAGAEARLHELVEAIRRRLGALVIGEGEERIESVVGRLLRQGGYTIATAESCTGGLIASLLTDVPGSSAYLLEGVVVYSNAAKVRQLGVCPDDLETHGAVSEPVVRQMAQGIRGRTGADFGLATTGIAGPDGGTDEKPVGTLHLALATADGIEAQRYQLMRDRARNKLLAAHIALDWVRRRILGLGLPDQTYPRLRGTSGPTS